MIRQMRRDTTPEDTMFENDDDITFGNTDIDTEDRRAESNYGFISASADQRSTDDDRDDQEVRRWRLGSHQLNTRTSVDDLLADAEQLDEINPDLKETLEEAAQMVKAQGGAVNGFECPVCGLNHSHPDHKHDIREAFDVEAAFAERMQYVPYCHCGVNELAMLVDYFAYISEPVFADQHEFESVLELSPETIKRAIRAMQSEDKSPRAASMVPSEVRSPGVRRELQQFLNKVRRIKRAAEKAPIAGETRQQIETNRDALDERLGR